MSLLLSHSSSCIRCCSTMTDSGSAFKFAMGIRSQAVNQNRSKKNPIDKQDGAVLPNKLTWSFHNLTEDEVTEFLMKNVIWNKYDIVAINKPYNVCCQGGHLPKGSVNLVQHLPELARRLNCSHLHLVHRLDRTSTGVLLLAKTEVTAKHLRRCFKERRIEKYYYCITRDVPEPEAGCLSIPILEVRHADGRARMTLRPRPEDLADTPLPLRGPQRMREATMAHTQYQVVDRFERSALVEAQPLTGCKHQIRVHLGFGLETPVLGDHKYSRIESRSLPQRVPECTLRRLNVKASRARDLPLFLHAQRVVVPVDPSNFSKTSVIKAPFPKRFVRTMRSLRLQFPFRFFVSKFL